jgi:mRNA interferase MazF
MGLARINRGEIWLVNLNPQTHVQEIAKDDRPCLVIQTNLLNHAPYSTTVVIPCTTDVHRDKDGDGFPLKISLGRIAKPGCAPEETDALITAVRSIANARFKGQGPIATLERVQMKRVEDALKMILDLP